MNKEKKNKLVPELRFPEFTKNDEWVEKKLDEITSSIFDGTHQTPKYTQEGVPFFSVENIISGNKNKYISREDYLLATNKNKPEKGDILITRIGNIGSSKLVDWDYEFSIYVTLAVIKKSEQFEQHYLHSFLQSDYYQNEIRSKSLLNAVPAKINMDELRKTKVLLPKSKKEQRKIADCLSSLDDLITAENQKLRTLIAHKKGMMEQLFPVEGEKVPKLRFKEFRDTGDLIQESFEQLYSLKSTNSFSRDDLNYKEGTIKNIHYGDIHTKFSPQFSISKENVPFIDPSKSIEKINRENYCMEGDMIFADASEDLKDVGKSIEIVNLNGEKLLSGMHTILARQKESKLVIGFGGHMFLSSAIRSQIQKEAQGAKVLGISGGRMANVKISYPKDKEEQQKIVDCLSSLDDLIKVQDRKVEVLKTHKKGLMQRLFPNTPKIEA